MTRGLSYRTRALRAGLAAWCAGALVALTAVAEAGAPRRVEIRIAPCNDAPYEPERFMALLRVELSSLNVTVVAGGSELNPSPEVPSAMLTLALERCERSAHDVALGATDAASGRHLERRVEIGDIAFEARARALAIAAAELYRATTDPSPAEAAPPSSAFPVEEPVAGAPDTSAKGPVRSPAPSAPAPPSVANAPVAPAAPPPVPDHGARPFSIEAAVAGRAYPSERSALFGGDLGAGVAIEPWLGVRAGAELAFGDSTLPIDDANELTGNVALGLVLAHAALLVRTESAPWLELGPRVGTGYGWVKRRLGNPVYRSTGWSSELGVEARAYGRLVRGMLAALRLATGHTLGGITLETGQGTVGAGSAGIYGVFFELGMGIAFEP